MKQLFPLFFGFAILLAGCSKEALNDNNLFPAEASDLTFRSASNSDCPVLVENLDCDGVQKTLKFRSAGTITFEAPPSACVDLGATALVVIEGSGNMTHLGKYTVELSYCMGGTFPDTYPITLPEGSVTAANGDQLFIQYTAPLEPDDSGWQHYIVLGGTGRFENACGYWDFCGGVDFETGTFAHEGRGAIKY